MHTFYDYSKMICFIRGKWYYGKYKDNTPKGLHMEMNYKHTFVQYVYFL